MSSFLLFMVFTFVAVVALDIVEKNRHSNI